MKRTCCTAARRSSSVRVLAVPGGGVTISLPRGCADLLGLGFCDSLTLCAPLRARISCSRAVRLGSEYITGLGVGPGLTGCGRPVGCEEGAAAGAKISVCSTPASASGSWLSAGVPSGTGSDCPQSMGGKYFPDRISSRIRAASRRPSSVPLNRARLYASTSLAVVSGSIPYTGDVSLNGGIYYHAPLTVNSREYLLSFDTSMWVIREWWL